MRTHSHGERKYEGIRIMGDFKLIQDDQTQEFDLEFDGDFVVEDGLRTAVIISLFSHRRVTADELPPGETDKRGWWGDTFNTNPNDRTGSKLWLLARTKETQETLNQAKEFTQQALQWMITEGLASTVEVETSFFDRGKMLIEIAITRPSGERENFRFDSNWESEVA
jgi:phage gp46-like protein